MTWEAIKLPLYNLLTALLTAAGMYWGIPALTPAAAPPKAVQPGFAAPLPTTVVCDTGALQPSLRLLEGLSQSTLAELRQWREAESKRQVAEAAYWAAKRAARAASK